MDAPSSLSPQETARRHRLGLFAQCAPERLQTAWPELPPHELLRAPEIGTVMVQGRIGATQEPFHLGEMTVTRASVQLESGEIGHAMVQGRDKTHALRAACLDALAQNPRHAQATQSLIDTLAQEAAQAKAQKAAQAQATRVEFFTLIRGEDQ